MIQKFIIFIGVFALLHSCKTNTRSVYMRPTLHTLHQVNSQYSYIQLRQTVAALKPDLIAVEIRSEDLMQDSLYLKKNYPYEMWMMKQWFPAVQTAGFD
ncbi:hypothetical protein KSK37_12825 [Kaistella sp. DKR-2]|uniref:hypothetical protein n=1 Tax=Kaistella soli TaxID=2849654 RepID=UPI001C273F0D|nr:hypothetical protein [Kaistella soli]MBU8883972.1 hypothetical protein [Kaistella soli]